MAHIQQLQFVKSVATSLNQNFEKITILEVGSYDVNGSVRKFFPNSTYLGVDLIEGPSVDLVCEGDKIEHEDDTYDIAISCECFEHNPSWAETFINMYRMTKQGGIVLFTCATTGRPEHGTTRTDPKSSPGTQALKWDYYKNLTEEDFLHACKVDSLFKNYFFITNEFSHDLYFLGIKGQSTSLLSMSTSDLKKICLKDQEEIENFKKLRKTREKFIPKPLRNIFRKFFP
jgi:SAM-dependent methyltransferase